MSATLEQHRRGGAVAEKFEAAYLRSLDFADFSKAEAEHVYVISQPSEAEYKTLQDFLFDTLRGNVGDWEWRYPCMLPRAGADTFILREAIRCSSKPS